MKSAADAVPHGRFPARGCSRGGIHALKRLFLSVNIRAALPSIIFRQRFWVGVLAVASVGIEDENGTVFDGMATGVPDSARWSNDSSLVLIRRLGRAGSRVYHANLPFDFPAECGGMGANLGFTNGLREWPSRRL